MDAIHAPSGATTRMPAARDPGPHRGAGGTTRRLGAAAALALGLAGALGQAPAMAHEDHGKAVHGGTVAEAGAFQGELVARGGTLTLHLTDHGKPIPTQGASARMAVLSGGQKADLVLAPAGENRLAASGAPALGAGAKAVANVRLPDGRSGALRFDFK